MKQLILASHNAHKVREIRELLEGQPVEVLSLSDIAWTEEIEENGSSFEENALIKARRIYAETGRAVLADDSGLEVDALDGGPGIYSSRFMGEETPYEEKNAAIIAKVEGLPEEQRGADFRCVMAFVYPGPDGKAVEKTAEGRVNGTVAHQTAGGGGFGYDPLFYLPERGCTMAELSEEEKNAISHRGRALRAVLPFIREWLTEDQLSGTESNETAGEAAVSREEPPIQKGGNMRSEINLRSSDDKTQLRGYLWKPEGEVKGVIQLVHGMEEHIVRYDEFARWLAKNGYGVIGHDHLGHGGSINSEEDLGYFAKEKGNQCVLRDMHAYTLRARKEFPDKPVFMLGHSMGSFFARRYVSIYPRDLDGLILSGTGQKPYLLVHGGKRMAKTIAVFKGDRYRSKFIEKMALGSQPLEKWLCTRQEVVDSYRADPLCGQPFTVGAYANFFRLLEELALEKDKDRVPKDLPILLIAGMKDPVGDMSKGVLKVYNRYKAWGLTDVDAIFYKDDMHEILNEADREDVFRDVLHFLDTRVERK
ncbi:MAG: RdgB/HAM1 family non-canonical purine NTP pyrophosphatase [Lachnospiraceae bacterium]|nr:RdgB/HAM1 family non-canonical purine NTP pyrophosphatase [Lachnospiraceae bacterium]